ncbi:FkbM family methyltransferase [Lusitaniella coriacea]|uniref:FkbM family methyltransferase n=1 Tax=Lusitaniella coriacea TaxID=1983105 RepID=UPI003CF8E6D0
MEKSKPGAVFSCQVNGIDILAPVELLRLYPHCLYLDEEKQPIYWIEPQQSDWLCEKVQPGDTVFDIGAAFGVISVALSQKVGKSGSVHSFDPSQTAQKVLRKVINFNELSNIEVVHKAIADRAGMESFIEYTADNELSWASDASSLYAETIDPTLNHVEYTVEVTTIDDYVAQRGLEPKAIKIDIEGFELYGLRGGKKTLEQFAPYLCIDIHRDVKTGESALLGVEPFLQKLGYDLRMEDHAVYCTPKKLVNSAGR